MSKVTSPLLNYIKRTRNFWFLFLCTAGTLSLWLFAFFPGIMTPDSIDQWQQASTLSFSNWHPYLSTLYLVPFKAIIDSPAIIALIHILWTSLLFAYAFDYFLKQKVNLWVIGLLFLMLITSIPIGIYTITLWKDIPFALAFISLGFLISRAALEKRFPNLIGLLLFLTIIAFFRHNGAINLFVIPVIIVVAFFRKFPKQTYLFLSGTTLISLIVVGLLPYYLKIAPVPSWFTTAPIYYETVSYLRPLPMKDYTPRLSAETIVTLNKIMSVESLLKSYDPRSSEPLLFSSDASPVALNTPEIWESLRKEFWSYNLIHNFHFFLGNRLVLFMTSTLGYGAISAHDIYVNNLNLSTSPLLPNLNQWLKTLMTVVGEHPIAQHLIWNSLFAIVLQLYICINSWYTKKQASFLLSIFIVINTISLASFNIAGDWRYYYFVYLSIFIGIPFFIIESKIAKQTHK